MLSKDALLMVRIRGAESILVLVLVALMVCRKKNVKNVFVHAFLQLTGVLGLVMMGGFAYLYGAMYLAALVLINEWDKKDEKMDLRTSPLFTLLGFGALAFLPQLENLTLFSEIDGFTGSTWWLFLAATAVFYLFLVLLRKSNQVVSHFKTHYNLLPIVSGVLIFLPWLLYAGIDCLGQSFPFSYAACAIGPDPFSGGMILTGTFLGLIYCKNNNIKRFEVHALLQIAGIVGLLGFRSISFVPGFLYALALLAIYYDKDSERIDLRVSPIYTAAYLSVLFTISEFAGRVPLTWQPRYLLTLSWRALFPKQGPELWFFYLPLSALVIGLIAVYVRSKTRSVVAAFLVATPLSVAAFYILMRLTFRGVLNFS